MVSPATYFSRSCMHSSFNIQKDQQGKFLSTQSYCILIMLGYVLLHGMYFILWLSLIWFLFIMHFLHFLQDFAGCTSSTKHGRAVCCFWFNNLKPGAGARINYTRSTSLDYFIGITDYIYIYRKHLLSYISEDCGILNFSVVIPNEKNTWW